MQNSNFEYEKNKLGEILDGLEETLEGEKLRLKVLPKKYGHDPRLLEDLMSITSQKIRGIETHIDKPYFARIDFESSDLKKKEQLYIGKVGVIDLDGKILVTDWRSPIATLYYDSNLGKAEYVSPKGKIEGTLELKRQIVIERKQLLEIFDVDSVSDDELLKPYLGANADNRLKNIVASIQKEQNNIIRKSLNNNLIVQGVAGSGKTTVALHRIAYLMYNNSNKYKSDQFMVIGPNKFFLNYISNVLPDLDAGQIEQYTYEELVKTYINEKFTIREQTQMLTSNLSQNNKVIIPKYKLSMKYKEEIDKFLEKFQNDFIDEEGICVNDFCIYNKQEVMKYIPLSNEIDFSTKLQSAQKMIEEKIKNSDEIVSKAKKYFDERIKNATSKAEEENYTKIKWDTVDKINSGLKDYFRKKLSINNKKIINIYKIFVSNYEKYCNNEEIMYKLKSETLDNINKKELDFEDLPALMYIKYKLFGSGEFKKIAHVVVDEAQDFGTFNFFTLKQLLSKSTFSIFGDLTQGIYEYRAINSWEEVIEDVFSSNCDMMQLEKSYRTTVEIMLATNLVSKWVGLFEGKPVIRHGEEVKIKKMPENDKLDYILKCIEKNKNMGHNSIAVICKTLAESKKVYEKISKYTDEITLILEDKETYNGGICIVPAHLSKGLEFDCVIIYDADESIYSSMERVDMKLLYVAMTRALHTLDILYTDELTKPLTQLK